MIPLFVFVSTSDAFHSICMLVLRPPFLCGSNNGWGDIGFDTHTETMEKVGSQEFAAAAKMLQLIFQTIQCLRVQASGYVGQR